jgi:hypothetical protein
MVNFNCREMEGRGFFTSIKYHNNSTRKASAYKRDIDHVARKEFAIMFQLLMSI